MPAGTHDYECSVPETTNYFGATKTDSYIIDKILAQVSLTLNGQANDISLAPGAQLDVSGQTADGDQNPATKPTLSENSTVIGTGATYPFTLTKTWNPGVGTYAYKYDYLDSENYTATSLTRTATVQDTEAPQWSNNKTSPLSPTDYAPGKQYQFNVTWTDNTGVAQVWFSWTSCSDQGCGGYTMPVTTKNGDEYYVDMSDLPAGNYSFSWRAEDAYGNSAITDTWKYLINPADPTDPLNPVLHLSLNGVEADQAVSYGTTSTALGWKDFIEGSLTLFRDGAVVANPEALVLGAELYNYTLYFPGSANYTSGSVERFLTVDQRAPSVIFTITPPSPITYGVATTATCTSPDVQMTLTRDGNDVTGTENGAPVTLTAGTHSYACDYAGNQNFTSYNSEGFYVVNKASTTLYLALDGLEGDKTYNLGQTINAYGWVFLDQSPPLLFVDNDQVATAVENTPGRTNIWYPSVQNAGVHNYTIALNHENYTAAPVTRFATVTDTEANLVTGAAV